MKTPSAIHALLLGASFSRPLATALAALLTATVADAATYTWTNVTTGAQSWTTAGNWFGGTQYVSDPANELRFFADSTTNIGAINQTFTNVPATLSMNTLTLNGRGPGSGASSSSITIGSGSSTWTIGDGTTSTVNLNANFGASSAANFNYNVASNITLNQATTLFTGTGTAGVHNNVGNGFLFSGIIADGVNDYGITKSGTSRLTLSGASTYSGTTTLNNGILQIGRASVGTVGSITNSAIGTGGLTLGGGTLSSDGATARTILNAVTFAGNMEFGHAGSTGKLTFSAASELGAATRTLTANSEVEFAGPISSTGAFGINKAGTGVLTLSGTNTYEGATSINAGTLSISSAANLGNAAANLVFNGGTLRITGTGLTTLTGLGRTNPLVFTSGQTVSLDIADAANVFTADQVLNQGTDSLTKLGAGILATNQANTYTGASLVNAGTFQLGSGTAAGSLDTRSGINVASGATFAVNQTDTVTQGADFGSHIIGAGALANLGSGTLVLNAPTSHTGNTSATVGNITLNSALAIRNSALNTTGAGFVTLGTGITTPTFGGLSNSGTTRNLADVITTGYGNITSLTLNPQSGVTHTYGGVIADGATGMTLTKTGAGTQTLTGANAYTGATTINQGTLNLGGATANGSLASTVLNLSGGTLAYTRTGTNTQSFTTTNITGGASAVTTSVATQTVALNNIVRSTGGTANFSGGGAISTTNTLSNGILGGWATFNNENWATKTGNNISGLGVYVVANATAATNDNTNMDAATVTIGGVINTNSIRFSGGSVKTLTLAAGDNIIQSGGILVRSDVGTNLQTITGGNLLGSASGDLIVHQHGGTTGGLTIASLIKNNGGATALTKSGAGLLTLSNASNSYSGGTIVNAGTLTFSVAGAWVSGQNLTFGGAGTVSGPASATLTGGILNAGHGVNATIGASVNTTFNFTSTTGAGTINYTGTGTLNLGNASAFTGNLISSINGGNNGSRNIQFSSIADTAGSFIGFGGSEGDSNQRTMLTLNGNVGALTLNNRQVEFLPNTSGSPVRRGILQNNNTSPLHTFVINTNLFNNGVSGKQELLLDGTNAGNNAFNGTIGNSINNNSAQSVYKTGTGRWILSGANTYTGLVIVNQGTLSVGDINNANVAGPLGMNNTIQLGGADNGLGGSSYLAGGNSGTLEYTGAGQTSTRSFRIGDNVSAANNGGGGISNNGSGALSFTAANFNTQYTSATATRTLTLGGTNTDNNTISGIIQNNNTAGGGLISLAKTGIGTWVISGANSHSGTSSISGGGRLVLDYSSQDNRKLGTGSMTLAGGTIVLKGGTATETASSTIFNTNSAGTFFVRDGGTAKINLNAFTVGTSSTVSFSHDSMATTDRTNVGGILGAWFTVGNRWASNSTNAADGDIVGYTGATTLNLAALPDGALSPDINYNLAGGGTLTASRQFNTLRIESTADNQSLNIGASTLTVSNLTGTNAPSSYGGGLLYAGGANGNYTITGTTGRVNTENGNGQSQLINVHSGMLTLDAVVGAGTSAFVKSGEGTLVFNKANGYTGATSVYQGVLRLTGAGTLTAGTTVQNGAAIELGNGIAIGSGSTLNITGTGVSNGGALRNVATTTSSYAAVITIGAGGARINSDSSGALTLSGGVVTSLFNNVTFGGAGNTTVQTAAISGAGGLIKDSTGTLNLNFANTYTGSTQVNQGILAVNGTGSINSSAVTVNGGNFRYNSTTAYTGELTFTSGTISGTNWNGSLGNQTVATGDILSPGNSPGTATTTGQTWAAGGTYEWEINSTAGNAGLDPGWDLISGTGTLNITATAGNEFSIDITSLTLGNLAGNVSDFDDASNYSWLIAEFATITGFDTTDFILDDSAFANIYTGTFGLSFNDGVTDQIFLTYTAIPEPGAALLGGLGVLLLLRRRR